MSDRAQPSVAAAPPHPNFGVAPFWPPLVAGIALGLVLLLTFALTGHGLGATGATTRLAAWLGLAVAPEVMLSSAYLGPLVEDGHPLSAWISWQVLGVALGAVVAARLGRRFRVQLDGARRIGALRRLVMALGGGLLAGFGARVAQGCTSGLGLSGGATLALAAFVFLGAFFAGGLLASRVIKGV
ncbi:MAG: YeeE/YedE thiosulfate transporter family protein [Burkholderiaceae bacterium]|uniref:YeeE/YedE thiosulfate transporter family protein n=1 Tax=Hydrogenophaga sp. TaxID=1904254 RepID=UPI002774857A|nr:YeeE/YedE thiosulfate transporter family protein [Hydrogenophaga sp.]MDP2065306.1 YeeE/YedE thiosulfate transporter family protein [Burkholderiaceae bacterium]MDZ4145400.1 YeeE/YedE thiosulfate transporter family protein [Burkholderiales bacterium]MDZ4396105.1 YeeE/YedE thiosulfate transporter family protein [Hydrogenophaga sp.]